MSNTSAPAELRGIDLARWPSYACPLLYLCMPSRCVHLRCTARSNSSWLPSRIRRISSCCHEPGSTASSMSPLRASYFSETTLRSTGHSLRNAVAHRVLDPQDIPILRLVIATLRYQTTPTLARGQGRTLPLHAIGNIVLRGECGSVGGGHTEKERQAHQRARKSLSHSVRLSGSCQSLATATASIPETGHHHPSHGHKTGI